MVGSGIEELRMMVDRGDRRLGVLLIQCHAEGDIVESVDVSYSEML